MLSLKVGIGRERQILLVCKGNTCRSTMALAVFSGKLSVSGDEGGEWNGYSWKLSSAGTQVDIPGRPANPNSLFALQTMGFDTKVLDKHESRLLTRKDFYDSHYVLCMDDSNLHDALLLKPIDSTAKVMLLGDNYKNPQNRNITGSSNVNLAAVEQTANHYSVEETAVAVADPYGRDLETYVETLGLIERLVSDFLATNAQKT